MISTPLLPLESTDSLGNFGDGNKPKTIANRDQKIRRIPSRTMLRLISVPRRSSGVIFSVICSRLRLSSAVSLALGRLLIFIFLIAGVYFAAARVSLAIQLFRAGR